MERGVGSFFIEYVDSVRLESIKDSQPGMKTRRKIFAAAMQAAAPDPNGFAVIPTGWLSVAETYASHPAAPANTGVLKSALTLPMTMPASARRLLVIAIAGLIERASDAMRLTSSAP
jgi:hypothetical protein